jgi:hypothetical protein
MQFAYAFSPLQTMVSFEATASTIARSLNREMFSESIVLNAISSSHYIGCDIISTGLLGFAFINKIINVSDENINIGNKWKKITLYSQTQNNINNLILIIMIIFTKNIENAI